MGSKRRIARYILPIILAGRTIDQWYVEPFCGGLNTIQRVTGKRLAADNKLPLIELYEAIKNGWVPKDFYSEEEYATIKNKKIEVPLWEYAFVGSCAFGGKFFGGYPRNKKTGNNAFLEVKNSLLKNKSSMQGIIFRCESYYNLSIPPNSLIYCDPPYKDTYQHGEKFDTGIFLDWVKQKAQEGHTIFFSEGQEFIDDKFIKVWESELKQCIDFSTKKTSKSRKEILYKVIP